MDAVRVAGRSDSAERGSLFLELVIGLFTGTDGCTDAELE
jgi:hypothetical protein